MKGLLIFAILIASMVGVSVHAQKSRLIVAKDGSGDFSTVQAAIDAVKDNNDQLTTIYIKKGIYKEKLRIPRSKINIYLIGEDLAETVLTYDDYASKKDERGRNIGTSGSASFYIYGSNITAENLTFENSSGPVGQAVAVRVSGDKIRFINCRFLGFQDTLYTHGDKSRQYYYKCYIEGTVDFIFGASTAFFDHCIIYGKKGGYFTAASTPPENAYGYVFSNCRLTGEAPKDSYYLGRPWRPDARTVFVNCSMDELVKPEGWHNWGKEENEKSAFYAEYKSSGAGAHPKSRVAWSHQLTAAQAKNYTIEKVFVDWNPTAELDE